MEEMESIRLKDHLGMDQREAADLMKVSQPTFHRIISEARRKIGCALVSCRHVWEVPHGTGRPENCPKCGSVNIHRAEDDRGYARAGHGRHGMQQQ
jgi:predicted RNA-binding Zn-ribbon protein involved in translation (DUF1610 family)